MTFSGPQATTPQRPTHLPVGPVGLTFLVSLAFGASLVLMQASEVGEALAALIYTHTGLAQSRGLDQSAWAGLLLACSNDPKCGPWLSPRFMSGMGLYWWALALPLVTTPVAAMLVPKKKIARAKDPGMARWEEKSRLTRFLTGNDQPDDPFLGFMGYLKSGRESGAFDTRDLPAMFVPREDWCQNTLVWGGIRSGKTTAFFQPNIMLAAHLGTSAVVFDVKWPQKNSGFFETMGYWKALGRPVLLLAPFETYGARVNLLAGVDNFSDALETADAVFPPPEFQEERGRHYNDKKRFMMASLIWLVRSSEGDAASMRRVLELTLMEDKQFNEFLDGFSTSIDPQIREAKAILEGYRKAGEGNFAETKNGIVSALKVFFNQNVAMATSGMAHETADLRDYIRIPSLTLVGINQKDQMDGSGEVLFRLYKRLLDKAAMQVVVEQGGRLRNHLAYYLDELPSIGRINYLMRSMSTLRSYNISHHLGIQNHAQGELVYSEVYWKAMTTNVVARTLMFPRGINGDDARTVSDTIGKTTALEVTVTGSRDINPFAHEGSNSASGKLAERYLLSYEEFADFSLGEAVIRMNGQHPIRSQLVPMNIPYVTGTGIKQGRFRRKKPNVLFELYEKNVARCPGGLIAYTSSLVESGALAGVAKDVDVPAAGAYAEVTQSLHDTHAWLGECMDRWLEITPPREGAPWSVKIDRENEDAINHPAQLKPLMRHGWVRVNTSRTDALIDAGAADKMPTELRERLEVYVETRGPMLWWKDNAMLVEGTTEREQYLSALAATDPTRRPLPVIEAQMQGDLLIASREVARQMMGAADLPFTEKRVNDRRFLCIPVHDSGALAAAIRHARESKQAAAADRKPSRKAQKRMAAASVASAVVMEPADLSATTPTADSIQP